MFKILLFSPFKINTPSGTCSNNNILLTKYCEIGIEKTRNPPSSHDRDNEDMWNMICDLLQKRRYYVIAIIISIEIFCSGMF